tara:strand:+ start:312 stop:557 length:246 start_codon:yes stop_codon:yes gene_type:complete
MARKSKAVFKMKGYSYPGTGPITKKAGPETRQFDVDDLAKEKKSKKKKRDMEIKKIYDIDGNVIGGTFDDDSVSEFDPYTD